MFGFMKKFSDKDDKNKNKKDKIESKRSANSLTADELLRLEEAKDTLQKKTIGDEESSSIIKNKSGRTPPPVPQTKPPKRGILKDKSSFGDDVPNHSLHVNLDDSITVKENTLANELISNSQHSVIRTDVKSIISNMNNTISLPSIQSKPTPPRKMTKSKASKSSINETTNGSNLHSLSTIKLMIENEKLYPNDLKMPDINPPKLLSQRTVVLSRQPTGDFAFSTRKKVILERINSPMPIIKRKTVVFAEPGIRNLNIGLFPGDQILEINNEKFETGNREGMIEAIKSSGNQFELKVQPVIEFNELSLKCQQQSSDSFDESLTYNGSEILPQNKNIWLNHRSGYCGGLLSDVKIPSSEAKRCIELNDGRIIEVDDEDIEKANPSNLDCIDNLTKLLYVNETSLLHTLRQRFANNLAYTYAGYSLLAFNPIFPLCIYSEKIAQIVKNLTAVSPPPHCYSFVQSILQKMMVTRKNQSILFLGNSGSGKSSNTFHALEYLVNTCLPINNVLSMDKLSAIKTMMQLISTCRRSNNFFSSHITLIYLLDFDQNAQIISASIQAMMLDRSRMFRRGAADTSFLLLSCFIAGISNEYRQELGLEGPLSEGIFITFPISEEENQRFAQLWIQFHHGLVSIGASQSEIKALYSVIAAIYHIDKAGAVKGTNNKFQFFNMASAQKAANVLGTSIEDLSKMIFNGALSSHNSLAPVLPSFRLASNRGNPLTNMSGPECIEHFVVGLYSELVQAIVALINRSLSSNFCTVTSIAIVDTPGFRVPRITGDFEDLCHNYVHERLNLLYREIVFHNCETLYTQENIDFDFSFIDNCSSALVQLIDRAPQGMSRSPNTQNSCDPRGILWVLDEAAILDESTDETFLKEMLAECAILDNLSSNQLLQAGADNKMFTLRHLNGTISITYKVEGWLKASRESPVIKNISPFLIESKKNEIAELFTGTGKVISSIVSGSIVGIEGASNLRRVSSMRRAFTSGTAGAKKRSIALQVKYQTDTLIEMLRRTNCHFMHCIMPNQNAAVCDLRSETLNPLDFDLDIVLLKSQLRSFAILQSVRLYKQGYPENMLFDDLRHRYIVLVPQSLKSILPVVLNINNMKDILDTLEIDSNLYKIGLTRVFFHAGVLKNLEKRRNDNVLKFIIELQSVARKCLASRNINKLRIHQTAMMCIQRNVRRYVGIKEWPWWRLYAKVKPILGVHRTEDELKDREIEIEQLRQRLEKSEKERLEYKQIADKIESKMSDIILEYQDEHVTSSQTADILERETAERLRLEKDNNDLKTRCNHLESRLHAQEVELMDAKMANVSLMNYSDQDENVDNDTYRKRLDALRKENEMLRKKMQQQFSEHTNEIEVNKKSAEKKLAELMRELEEQMRTSSASKKRLQKVTDENADVRLNVEQQTAKINELERKQKKFDSELSNVNEQLKSERIAKEKLQRERDEIVGEKYRLEQEIKNLKQEYEMQNETMQRYQFELNQSCNADVNDAEMLRLRKSKIELEARVSELEEECNEMEGTIYQLQQDKLKFEMNQEKIRSQHLRDLEEKDSEFENLKSTMQRKLRSLEMQLEEEHEDRQKLSREKRELENKIQNVINERPVRDKDVENQLKRDLRRTKALLQDSQVMLAKYKDDAGNRTTLKQLKDKLEDAEMATSIATKAKRNLELEINDLQKELLEANRLKTEAEDKIMAIQRDKNELQSQLEEHDEETNELIKKYKSAVQQHSLDLIKLEEQSTQIESLTKNRESMQDEISRLQSKHNYLESSMVDRETITRLETRIRDFEAKLDFESMAKKRAETQLSRLKEQMGTDLESRESIRASETKFSEQLKSSLRRCHELEMEIEELKMKEQEALKKKTEMEARYMELENEHSQTQSDLHLAFKRITDLQNVFNDDLQDSNESDSGSMVTDADDNEDDN